MTARDTFSLHPKSRIISPPQQGMAQLLTGLASGSTIIASQTKTAAITLSNDSPQWLLCETSGSAGAPKTIRRAPQSWTASFAISAQMFAVSPNDTYATLGPLGHSLTLYAALEAMHIGAGFLGLVGQKPMQQATQISAHKATVIYATPAQLRLLLLGAQSAKIETIPYVRHLLCGGGPLDMTLTDHLKPLFSNATIHEFFGASETSFITIGNDTTPQGSVGHPYPNVDLQIDQSGEIWIKSPYLFDGYANDDANDTQWRGQYLSIGEMGYLDANQNLFLRGRKSRMVTVTDHNVFPEQIEALFSQVKNVDACAVIPLPDPRRGHRIICILQAAKPLDFGQFRRLCHTHLGAASVPKEFIMIPQMPLLPAGKPNLKQLKRWLEARP